MHRNDQRQLMFLASSSVTTQSWANGPWSNRSMLAGSLAILWVGDIPKTCGTHQRTTLLAEGPSIGTVACQGADTLCVLRPRVYSTTNAPKNVAAVETLPSINTFVVSASLSAVALRHGGVGFDPSPNLATKYTTWLRLPPSLCSLSVVVSLMVRWFFSFFLSLRTFFMRAQYLHSCHVITLNMRATRLSPQIGGGNLRSGEMLTELRNGENVQETRTQISLET